MTTTDQTVRPTGEEHHFGVDELFFSTTDRRGVIEQANSIFVRLSHYSHEQLVGAPHNIIRHPDMPGGAFRLVWDELEAGRPACAYVVNLAQDGGRYWVFATLLPLGDGYLSVRMKPMVPTYWEASRNLYAFALPAERRAREEGASARDAATVGAESLAHGLGALGLGSFEAFTRATLPAEMAEHARHSAGLPDRPGAQGPLADVLDAMHDLDAHTLALVEQLEEYAALAAELRAAESQAGPTITRLQGLLTSAQQGARQVGDRSADLVQLADDMGERAATARATLGELGPRLAALEDEVTRMRLRISLLRLHNQMVGNFAAELIDGASTPDAPTALRLLCRALAEGAQAVTEDVAAVRAEIAVVPDQIRGAVREVDRFRRPLYKWQGTVTEAGVEDELGETTRAIEALTQEGFSALEHLSALAARLRLLDVPFEQDVVEREIAAMTAAVQQV